jgi:hypothetical protein
VETGLAPSARGTEQHTSLYIGLVKSTEVRRNSGSGMEKLPGQRIGKVSFKAEAGTTQPVSPLVPELEPGPELAPALLGHGGPPLVVHSPASL